MEGALPPPQTHPSFFEIKYSFKTITFCNANNAYQEGTKINTAVNERPLKNIVSSQVPLSVETAMAWSDASALCRRHLFNGVAFAGFIVSYHIAILYVISCHIYCFLLLPYCAITRAISVAGPLAWNSFPYQSCSLTAFAGT